MPSINREQGQSWPGTTTWRFWQNADGSISQAAYIEGQLPAALGQAAMAASLPVVIASDQSAVGVTGPLTGAQSLQTARAAGALQAAGAYDAAPTVIDCPTASAMMLFVAYTRGGAAGSVRLRIDVSPYAAVTAAVENWFRMSLYEAAVLAAGADANSTVQRETILYTATGAAAETFLYGPIELGGVVARLRIAAAEVGNVGAPGTCHIVALFQQGS